MGDMQRRLALALSLSALLIAGATYMRVAHAEKPYKALTVVNVSEAPSQNDTTIIDTPVVASDTAAPAENLTTTDLVGRQLMSQYLDLASNGQATDATIQELADNAANNIASLNTFTLATAAQLHIVADGKASFQTYGEALSVLNGKYQGLAKAVADKAGDLSDVTSKGFSSTMDALSKLEKKASDELTSLPVPASIAQTHLKLINNYLSSASAFSALSRANTDAATAFAGLVAQSTNSAEADSLLLSIETALLAQSITFTP